jgi:hypothetical protein
MTNGSGGHAAETRSAWGTPLPIIPGHKEGREEAERAGKAPC